MEILENDYLRLTILDNGALRVLDKISGALWNEDPWRASAGEILLEPSDKSPELLVCLSSSKKITIKKQGGSVAVSFDGPRDYKRGLHVELSLKVRVSLPENQPDVIIEITDLDFDSKRLRLRYIDYPLRAFSLRTHADYGYVALPTTQGCIIPTYHVKMQTTNFWALEDVCLDEGGYREITPHMPWFGAYKKHAGYVCIMESDNDAHIAALTNYDFQHDFMGTGEKTPYHRISAAWPRWLACRHELGYARKMRYVFEPGMGYVPMAKHYRAHANKTGLLKTLRQKQQELPEVRRIAGAPSLNFFGGYPHYPPTYPPYAYRYSDVRAIVKDLHDDLGLSKVNFNLWGGFTQQPPKALPFDTEPGSIEELKSLVRYAQDDCGYLFSLYNDISALIQWSPHWYKERLLTLEDGGHLKDRAWHRNCSATYLEAVKEVLPALKNELGVMGSYIDCLGVTDLRECYSNLHPMTRTRDRKNRSDLFDYIRSMGLVYGGEQMSWWQMPHTDHGNCVCPERNTVLFRLFAVPLFHLVFHDSAVLYGNAFDNYNQLDGVDFQLKVLSDLMKGVPPIFYFTNFDYQEWRSRIGMADRIMSRPNQAVAYDEMLTHEVLTDDFLVQETTFESGVKITVNSGLAPWDGSGEPIPGRGFRVEGMGATPHKGHFTTDINLNGG